MTKWILDFTDKAEEDLSKLDSELQKRIIKKLDWLVENFSEIMPLALKNEWQGFFKLRVGDCRIIYKVNRNENLINIWVIDRRDKVYERK